MAVPSSFDESNFIYDTPKGVDPGDIVPLSCFVQNSPALTISCWKFTKEELDEIIKTGRVWVYIYGHPIPPLVVSGHLPFEQINE
jgi:hypothetical protein